jgi:hypothetical protein
MCTRPAQVHAEQKKQRDEGHAVGVFPNVVTERDEGLTAWASKGEAVEAKHKQTRATGDTPTPDSVKTLQVDAATHLHNSSSLATV